MKNRWRCSLQKGLHCGIYCNPVNAKDRWTAISRMKFQMKFERFVTNTRRYIASSWRMGLSSAPSSISTLGSGGWMVNSNQEPTSNLKRRSRNGQKKKNVPDTQVQRQIEVYCMPGVSPAAASVSYEKKREEYQRYCYGPGLADHERLKSL